MGDLFDADPAPGLAPVPPLVPAAPGQADGAGRGTLAPLAERMRPCTLDEVVGQAHLLGPGRPLRVAFESATPHSMILWGPPGVGKTTLARLMADAFGLDFIAISAVLGGVKDIRAAVERAQVNRSGSGRPTVVFVDEVHRFNKAQQDAFLPHVESGLFVFIGATTENPSFEVVGALLSRAAVYVLQPLDAAELNQLVDRACADHLGRIEVDAGARELLVELADGDARRLLNALEICAHAAGVQDRTRLDAGFLRAALPATLRRFDKGGDHFYDQISALHKSVRGSDPDAALYWMVRMLDGGTDPRYIARRMVRMAVEDIGLADPRALRLALDAAEVYERLGSPEGELALAEALIYLAVTPKSNAVYRAYTRMREFVAADGSRPVPLHLRNAPTRLMHELGHGAGYRYAHDEAGAFAPGVRYLPDGVDVDAAAGPWYEPTERGSEARIRERLAQLRAINAAAGPEKST
jgi:putative ATPase